MLIRNKSHHCRGVSSSSSFFLFTLGPLPTFTLDLLANSQTHLLLHFPWSLLPRAGPWSSHISRLPVILLKGIFGDIREALETFLSLPSPQQIPSFILLCSI